MTFGRQFNEQHVTPRQAQAACRAKLRITPALSNRRGGSVYLSNHDGRALVDGRKWQRGHTRTERTCLRPCQRSTVMQMRPWIY